MEVSGVLISWASESSSADFSSSLWRAASVWLASSMARAFSTVMAARSAMARTICAEGSGATRPRLPRLRMPRRTGLATQSPVASPEACSISAATLRSWSVTGWLSGPVRKISSVSR